MYKYIEIVARKVSSSRQGRDDPFCSIILSIMVK